MERQTATDIGVLLCISQSFAVLAILSAVQPAPARAAEIPFQGGSTFDGTFDGANSVAVGDLDGDGDPDVVAAGGNLNAVAWWENRFPSAIGPTRLLIDSAFTNAFHVALADLDGDGDLDVVGAALGGDDVVWWQNDGSPEDNTTDDGSGNFWTEFPVDTNLNGARHVEVVDLDQDGDPDLLATGLAADTIVWYENDGTPTDNTTDDGSGNFWDEHTIVSSFNGASMATARDLDGDGDLDVAASARLDDEISWFESDGTPGDGGWTTHAVQPASVLDPVFDGPRSIDAIDLDGDGDLDLLAAARSGDEIAWWENDGSPNDDSGGDGNSWTQHSVDAGVTDAFMALAADLDRDGDLDIVGSADFGNEVAWWENLAGDAVTWAKRAVDTTFFGARGVAVFDRENDGDLDVVGAAHSVDDVAWWENETIHRSGGFVAQTPIASSIDAPVGITLADLDGDGDLDAVGGKASQPNRLAWWENPGDGTAWAERGIGNPLAGPALVQAADFDRDGDLDLLIFLTFSGVHDLVYWENDGSPADGGWIERKIATTGLKSAEAVDLDGDGDLDALVADDANDELKWWENDGTLPDDGTAWPLHTIAAPFTDLTVAASADIDGDGDLDVIGSSSSLDQMAWWENDGTPANDSSWTHRGIEPAAGRICLAAATADMDGDGDIDAVGCTESSGAKLAWWENDGTPSNDTAWMRHTVESGFVAGDIQVADFDLDGDLDLGAVEAAPGTLLSWFSNVDGDGLTWTRTNSSSQQSRKIASGDLDRDGDPDLVTTHDLADEIGWWRNIGGQFSLATLDTSPVALGEETEGDLLEITSVHRGRIGDSNAELVTFGLLFEESPGDALTTAEVNALLTGLNVYLDDGSGVFDIADALVTSESPLALDTAGLQIVSFVDGSADVELQPGAPRTYFVTVETTAGGGSAIPNSFRMTHVAAAESTGEDAAADLPILLEQVDDIFAELIVGSGGIPDHLLITNENLTGTDLRQACISITAHSAAVIKTGATVTFQAATEIVLGDGFAVESGAALIIDLTKPAPCP